MNWNHKASSSPSRPTAGQPVNAVTPCSHTLHWWRLTTNSTQVPNPNVLGSAQEGLQLVHAHSFLSQPGRGPG